MKINFRSFRETDEAILLELLCNEDLHKHTSRKAFTPITKESLKALLEDTGTMNWILEDDLSYPQGFLQVDTLGKDRKAHLRLWITPRKRPQRFKNLLWETVNFLFGNFPFNKISITLAAYDPTLEAVESLGFKREATFREDVFAWGAYHDSYHYGLLRAECPLSES